MSDGFKRQTDDSNESNPTLVNDNHKNDYIKNCGESILNLKNNSTLLNKPVTITWNNIIYIYIYIKSIFLIN